MKATGKDGLRAANSLGRDTSSSRTLIPSVTDEQTTPADPFEFYLRQYKRQFAAGTIKATSNMAWRAYLPDFSKLAQGSRQR